MKTENSENKSFQARAYDYLTIFLGVLLIYTIVHPLLSEENINWLLILFTVAVFLWSCLWRYINIKRERKKRK